MQYIVGYYSKSGTFVAKTVASTLDRAKEIAAEGIRTGFMVERNTDESTLQFRAWARNDMVILETTDS